MKIELFIPCFVDQFSPDTGFNMVKVLEKHGCKVNYNIEQTCCGLPGFNAGHWEDARELGEKVMNEVALDRTLVCGASSCAAMIRNSYDLLFQNSSYHNKYRQLQKKTFELSEFLVDVLKVESIDAKLNGRAVYLDSCHALNHCQIKSQPRKLLQMVEGLELLEIPSPDECCGFGGTFSVNYSEMSIQMAEQKVKNILQTGADILVSTDYTCLMHLDGFMKKREIPVRVMHIADVLAAGW
ncbi:MAG: (Fe-S)-binding protein [Bacteroidia bacterium]|nr:(Fe-S)-binding protein [Bacteroidia bacterium]MCF8427260.1 (Fe-S)-binding protein [Bacteroidia bacterium]MCF8445980.1 (Fe-S)-binding protein [Bacteroidia bacterium]